MLCLKAKIVGDMHELSGSQTGSCHIASGEAEQHLLVVSSYIMSPAKKNIIFFQSKGLSMVYDTI